MNVKKCEECGILYRADEDECPSCAALTKYILKYPELFNGAADTIARLHAFVTAETGLTFPPVAIAAVHRFMKLDTRICKVCKCTRPDDDMICPHCDEAKDYIDRSGLANMDRGDLIDGLNAITKLFFGELGYCPPPVLTAAAYKIFIHGGKSNGETRH